MDNTHRRQKRFLMWAGLFAALVATTACEHASAPADVPVVVQAWAHTGQEAERKTLQTQVLRFNRAQQAVKVELTLIPEGSYNAQAQAAAVANELPDVLEFDGPFLYAYVWQGKLRPLDNLLAPQVQAVYNKSPRRKNSMRPRPTSSSQVLSAIPV